MQNYSENTSFPQGVIVFFRLMTADGQLARSILPSGRAVTLGRSHSFDAGDQDYVVMDGVGRFLGCFPREFVSAILPLETTGPVPNADNPPISARN